MAKVAVNPPRTPVTAGSDGVAAATLPNVCKMPGPPAPFVPTPLPNVARSGNKLEGGSKTVKFGGKSVAIRGASFGSTGDIASKATGGGLVSGTTHGAAKFVAPGSMNVRIEGKAVHLLGDAMTNNDGNAATLPGVIQEAYAPTHELDKDIADALCDAACKAMADRGDARTLQDAMAKRFAEPRPPFYRPTNPRILPEVSQRIPTKPGGGMTTYLSSTGATVGAGGPTAPMSMMKALRTCTPGFMTRWDFVIATNPALPAANANIKHYVEVKFGNDELTENQRKARRRMTADERAKIVTMKPDENCMCTNTGGLATGVAR
jgi:uncharacterized Zn-binding protein involved in type VI secretion